MGHVPFIFYHLKWNSPKCQCCYGNARIHQTFYGVATAVKIRNVVDLRIYSVNKGGRETSNHLKGGPWMMS
jgi:hypothetical protein